MALKKEFIEWACSLSGCDGGNPDAKIWLSGIEWGGVDKSYYQNLHQEISKGKYTPSGLYDWKDSLTYPYGRNVAKLIAVIQGKDIGEYRQFANKCNGSEIFKMNLYPIAFRNTDDALWKKYGLDAITGFEEKHLFKTWCFLHRFPAVAALAKQKNPKVIICTGLSYLTDFFVCFASGIGTETPINTDTIPPPNQSSNQYSRRFYWAKLVNGTALFVVPFFSGQYGLNSDHLILEMGKIIKNTITSQWGQPDSENVGGADASTLGGAAGYPRR
jgi:hypothetical protein